MLRRALIGLFIGVSLAGTLGAYVPTAQAKIGAACQPEVNEAPCDDAKEYCSAVGDTKNTCVPNSQLAADQAKAQASATSTDNSSKVPITNPDQGAAYSSVMQWIMKLFAWLVGVAALTLQNAVYYTVVTMGNYINNLSAIGVAWRILRDMGNIVLIFGFLVIGLSTVLSYEIYGWGQKMLPKLLIAAVFVNFSLLAAEAVVDVGNLFATQFYTQINGGSLPRPVDNNFLTAISNEGISNKIMAQVGLQNIYGNAIFNDQAFSGTNSWLVGFMGIILFIVTAFVMFSLAFILIGRFVILVFLIIVSPVGVAGLAVPKLDSLAKKWWSTLMSETITAPVLLLLLYIALAVITDKQFLTGLGVKANGQFLGFVNNSDLTGFAATMLSFLIAMGLLLAVTILAKRMGSFGSAWAMKTAGAASFGVAGFAGRTSIGWGANKLANGARSTFVGRVPFVGTGITKGLDKVAGSSFDARGVKQLGGLGLKDAGTAQKGGYKADLKARIEARTKYAKELKGRSMTREEADRKSAAANAHDEAEEAVKKSATALAAAQNEQREAEEQMKNVAEGRARDRYWDASNPGQGAAAEQRKREADAALAEATKKASEAKTALEDAAKNKKAVENEIKAATSDKVAQKKYAAVLLAGLDEDNPFNKYINFAANTGAAKKINKDSGKSESEETVDALKEMIEKAKKAAEKEEEH